MAQATVPNARPTWVSEREFERWQARRRWARAGIMYVVMLFFAIIFLGPLLFATVSSLKTDPLEYPPTLAIPQFSPRNWSAAARLGAAGANDRWWGGFAPGATVPFELTYFVPEGTTPETPEAAVPRRRPGGGFGRGAANRLRRGLRRGDACAGGLERSGRVPRGRRGRAAHLRHLRL